MVVKYFHYSLITAIGMSGLLSGCSASDEEAKTPPVRATKFHTIGEVSNRFEMNFPAVMRAQQTSELAFTVPGYVQDIAVGRGELVTKGQYIARIDNRDYQSNLASARAQFDEAETEYQRAESLFAQNAIARMIVDQRKANRDVAKASLERMEKAVGDTAIYAPFTGQISAIHVEEFENVQAFQPIVTLQNNDSIVATIDVPSSLLLHIKEVTPEKAQISLEALPDLSFPAEFLEASSVPNADTQTYETRFTYDPPDNLLILPGMTGSLDVVLVAHNTVSFVQGLNIPVNAVTSEGEDTFVWVVDTNSMTVSKRSITIEPGLGDNVRVLSGLAAGETIAAAGVSYMYDGMTVRKLN